MHTVLSAFFDPFRLDPTSCALPAIPSPPPDAGFTRPDHRGNTPGGEGGA